MSSISKLSNMSCSADQTPLFFLPSGIASCVNRRKQTGSLCVRNNSPCKKSTSLLLATKSHSSRTNKATAVFGNLDPKRNSGNGMKRRPRFDLLSAMPGQTTTCFYARLGNLVASACLLTMVNLSVTSPCHALRTESNTVQALSSASAQQFPQRLQAQQQQNLNLDIVGYRLKFQPMKDINIPQYEYFTLDNGLQVYLMEDHEVPLIGGTLVFHGGSRVEEPLKRGVTRIMTETMRTGGSDKYHGEQLNALLENRAASIEATADNSSIGFSFGCLAEDLDLVFSVFADVVQNPIFPVADITRSKTQLFGSIARRNDDPNAIVSREMARIIYGQDSPYASIVENQTVRNIDRGDLVRYHETYIMPNNAILGIVGDFDVESMKKLITSQLGGLLDAPAGSKPAKEWLARHPAPNTSAPATPAVSSLKGTISIIDKPELSQAYVRMGSVGGRLNDSDHCSLDVLSDILNGLSGRLFNTVRSQGGLAYSVSGRWYPAFDHNGVFYAGGETNSSKVAEFMEKVLLTLKTTGQDITEDDVELAKQSTISSFAFNFDRTDDILTRYIKYAFYDYPLDFVFQYLDKLKTVNVDDVVRVSDQRIVEEDFAYLVVGDAKKIIPALKQSESLKDFPIIMRDCSIPK